MSSQLVPADLTGAVVGTTKTIDYSQFVPADNLDPRIRAHVELFNESGCGLQVTLKNSGRNRYLPAGAWTTFELANNDSSVVAVVTYVLPNPPVSTLTAVYYAPGEEVPPGYTLGNSPIGIGGTVSTSSVTTLSNETAGVGSEIIDIGTSANNKLIDIFNDHFIWSVLQSSVAHQVFKGNTSGTPLQMGQAGDLAEMLGNLKVDGTFESVGVATHDGASTFTGDATFAGKIIENAPIANTINGTAGTATVFYPIWGSALKIAIVNLSGYSSSANGQFVFPTAVANNIFSINLSGFTGVYQFMNGASVISSRILTALAVGGGTTTASNTISKKSIAESDGTLDRIQLNSGFVTDTGIILCIGS